MEIIVRARQNIFDITLQHFGDLNFVSKVIRDNNLTWSTPLEAGDVLQVNNDGLGNAETKNFFSLSGLIVQNGAIVSLGSEPLTFDSTNITWDRTDITFDNNPNV